VKEREWLGWRREAVVRAGMMTLRSLASTWRFTIRNGQALEAMRAGNDGFVFALWHAELLPLMWLHRREGVRVLISEHRDGEMIARIAESLGFETVRGSTTRGAGRALLGLSRALQSGEEVAITPDGPRGPARTAQPGALIAAARSGAAILPVACHARRAWRFNSWDRFMVPGPFARVTVAYGEAFRVDADSPRAAAAETHRLDRALNHAEEIATR
jgi:lysophospholipid acyltransferase (LPLAT)-like uncharacterized protein